MKRKTTILGVSLIHGEFQALAMIKGHTTHNWTCPYPVRTSDEFKSALSEAVRATQFPGRKVSILMEDARLVHQYYLVPPMKPADLHLYLDRMADQDKTGDGPAVWRSRIAAAGRARTGVLMDVWPKALVDDLVRICQEADLTPVQLFPLSAVFVDQVRTLGVEPEEIVLLATVVAGKALLVVATGDGNPIFDRFLIAGPDDQPDGDRIAREITRSILFANQQLNVLVDQVWVMGEQEGFTAEHLQSRLNVPVLASPIVPDAAYWIWVGMMLPVNHSSNFITPQVRRVPVRKMMLKTALALMVGIACLSVSTTGLVEALVEREQRLTAGLREQVQRHQADKRDWQQRLARLERQREWSRAISHNQPPPVAGWFLSYVAGVLPEKLILHRVAIHRNEEGWVVNIEGIGPGHVAERAEALAQLEQALATGPFHMRIRQGWRKGWKDQLQQGGQHQGRSRHERFVLEGLIT